jgi:hypothetical protein
MKRYFLVSGMMILAFWTFAQNEIAVYPVNWWVGMKNPKLQLMVRGEKIANAKSIGINYPGIRVDKITKVANENYVFIDLTVLPAAKPGTAKLRLTTNSGTTEISYELKSRSRENGKTRHQGVTQEDFVYLLMPDRFANGDPSNDAYGDMLDKEANRKNPFLRHGGDIQGVINHLDYLKSLGVTALWMTPVIENNTCQTSEGGTQRSSYHGYHFTINTRLTAGLVATKPISAWETSSINGA